MRYEINFLPSYDRDSVAAELRRVAALLGKRTLTGGDIDRYARLSASTVQNRFGSIRLANEAAGLAPSTVRRWTDDELLEIIRDLWAATHKDLQRCPMVTDLRVYGAPVAATTIAKRFGGWRRALMLANGVSEEDLPGPRRKYRDKRSVSLKTRFQVLKRDLYKCRLCGRSAVELEVDHIVPLSRGGRNQPDNLQTLCAECNRGKGGSMQ